MRCLKFDLKAPEQKLSVSSPILRPAHFASTLLLPSFVFLSAPLHVARRGPVKAFSESLSNDPRDPDALHQHQLMEGMQLASTLAPERLRQTHACVCVRAGRERAFGSHALHKMGLDLLRKSSDYR